MVLHDTSQDASAATALHDHGHTHTLSLCGRTDRKNLGDVDSSLSRLIWPRETLYTELELEHIPPKNP
jgi:hypothetical protein